MPITSEIEFTSEGDTIRYPFADVSADDVRNKINNNYTVMIVNTFVDEVTLNDMIESTEASINLFNQVEHKIDVLAIMREGNVIQMRLRDITETPTILAFATNKWRGTTVAVIEGKNTAKFFLNIANHLIQQAGFITSDSVKQAYAYIEKQRQTRIK